MSDLPILLPFTIGDFLWLLLFYQWVNLVLNTELNLSIKKIFYSISSVVY